MNLSFAKKSCILYLVLLGWSSVCLASLLAFPWSWWSPQESPQTPCEGCYDTVAQDRNRTYQMKILNSLYILEPTTVNKFPVIELLKNHLANVKSDTTWQFQLTDFSNFVHTPALFRNVAENSRRDYYVKMGPKTSFYFYLGLLSLLRDVPLEGLTEERPDIHAALSKAYRNWSESGMRLTFAQSKSMTDDQTIRSQIVEHHREYFELLIWRFLAANNSFDGWGGDFASTDDATQKIASYQDSWNRVSAELSAYRQVYSGGHDPKNLPFSVLMANMRRMGVKHAPKAEEIRERIPFDISTEVVIPNSTVGDSETSHLLLRQRRN